MTLTGGAGGRGGPHFPGEVVQEIECHLLCCPPQQVPNDCSLAQWPSRSRWQKGVLKMGKVGTVATREMTHSLHDHVTHRPSITRASSF